MGKQDVLIIDDEPDIRELLALTLSRMDINTDTAESFTEAKQQLSQHSYHLCLTDMNLPDGDGIEVISHIQKFYPNTPVAMITAYGSMEIAINALKTGAFDFITKPIDLNRLRDIVSSALKLTSADNIELNTNKRLLGNSLPMNKLRQQITKLARSQAPIYINGESGTGKELAARLIHDLGPRKEQPFIAVNCGAIPSELMESEFFGHTKGSFTGANTNKAGLFKSAQGGTLFLDEIADLPLSMQVKLLRTIQEKSVRAIGSATEEDIDVRILSASHKDLNSEVQSSRFRQDLFYRLNVIELKIPALRDRSEDIPLLADNFLQKLANNYQQEKAQLSNEALSALKQYIFPGNVRELENLLERAVTLMDGNIINIDDILFNKQPTSHAPATSTSNASHPAPSTATNLQQAIELPEDLDAHLASIEKGILEKALQETRWNKTAAAEKLGISFRSLRYRLKKLGME